MGSLKQENERKRSEKMKTREIQSIIKDFETSSLQFLELEMNGFKLKLSKTGSEGFSKVESSEESIVIPKVEEVKKAPAEELGLWVTSPLVGTFYAATSPSAKPLVEVGQKVKKGQVLCIIEAMKIMNEITSPYDGIVASILVKNGDVIGYDQRIMRIGEEHEE